MLSARTGLRAAALLFAGLALTVGTSGTAPAVAPPRPAGYCDANDNLGEIANNFISRCRKGSIRQVFPGQHYGDTLGYLKDCGDRTCKTAWKLLNDNRFAK
ncbi:hypothetical protein ABT160_09895 [Streptomyces sp. NPDC001941]|uniref:hypothetical protein n=1 Tax=Streptomyces sp. NPDC001941 TaxID=3154659 RepID=UPI00332519F0